MYTLSSFIHLNIEHRYREIHIQKPANCFFLCYYSYFIPHKPPTALLLSFVVTTAHFMLPHLAVIPLNHTVNNTGQLSLAAPWQSISRTTWITWLAYAVIGLAVPNDSKAGVTWKTLQILVAHWKNCLYGINWICHSYKIFFNGPFVYCGGLEEYKGRGWLRRRGGGRKRGGESLQDCENLKSKQTL